MADFDAINPAMDEEDSSSLESYTQIVEPVIIRGTGNITVWVGYVQCLYIVIN